VTEVNHGDGKRVDIPPQELVAQVKYRKMGLRVNIAIYDQRVFLFRNKIDSSVGSPSEQNEDASQSLHTKSSVTVTREGMGRTYRLEIIRRDASAPTPVRQVLYWKGSKSALSLMEDQPRRKNGNLKLVSPERPDTILAVWQNSTDRRLMGGLSVFEEMDEGEAGILEEVVTSCLAVVMAERGSWRGRLGGMGKRNKRQMKQEK
jgi:hypothetical protein